MQKKKNPKQISAKIRARWRAWENRFRVQIWIFITKQEI